MPRAEDNRNGLDRAGAEGGVPARGRGVVGGRRARRRVQRLRLAARHRRRKPELRAENERLRVENALLRQRQIDVDELASLLEMKRRLPSRSVAARVVGGSLTAHYRLARVSVDGGSSAIAPGMPVVTGAGLIGRVEEVVGGYADVLLITDPRFVGRGRAAADRRPRCAHRAGPLGPLPRQGRAARPRPPDRGRRRGGDQRPSTESSPRGSRSAPSVGFARIRARSFKRSRSSRRSTSPTSTPS